MKIKTFWHKKEKQQDKKSVKIHTSDIYKYKTAIEIRFADFDILGHINNAVYFTYLEIARSKYLEQAIKWDWQKTGIIIAKASLDYIMPIFINDKINMYVRTSRIGKSSFDLEYLIVKINNGKEVTCSKGTTVCVAFDYTNQSTVPIPEDERNKMIVFEQLSWII